MTVRIGLEQYTVLAKHGYYEFEHEQDQPFVFTVWATLVDDKVENNLKRTLNYADIQIAIDQVMLESEQPIALIEEMAARVIHRIKSNELVGEIHVRIEKPNAPLPHPGGLPVIEVLWSRS
ncbi:dihydroneopterin aldolase [Euryarchaeota archaeon]|nr:dihydroneopterin aldolase [Euryarchaeota archaeon]MDB9834925.1 dihydroneopterin aldolase [Candidatus Poseidoniaceae archaeon]